MPGINDIGWFQIGTDQPAATESFYHAVFGWTFADDGATANADGTSYRNITVPGNAGPSGGLFASAGTDPNHAIFYLVVTDVAETCRQAESAGGKVMTAPKTTDVGLTFAHLLDPVGNRFGVFTPPARP